MPRILLIVIICALLGATSSATLAQETATAAAVATTSGPTTINLSLGGGEDAARMDVAVEIVLLMTLLSLAPALLIMMTSFTRIVIVLGFLRQAMGTNQMPSNQIIIGLALFLSFSTWRLALAKALRKRSFSCSTLAAGT